MARFGMCGAGYQSQSPDVDPQVSINFYPESVESGWGKSAVALYGTPGMNLFVGLPELPGRGFVKISSPSSTERVFEVCGQGFYEVFSGQTYLLRNPANPFYGTGLASMAASPTQILIVDGGQAFCYNLAQNIFQPLQTYAIGSGSAASPYSVSPNNSGKGYPLLGGSGYNIGDILVPATSLGTGATFTVSGTASYKGPGPGAPISGIVAAVVVSSAGSGYTPQQNCPTTGGAGSGCQLNFSVSSIQPGSGLVGTPILCSYVDGFFIVLQQNSNQIQVSQPYDASVWDPTQVAQVSVFPDNVVSMLAAYRQLWLWGSKQTQVYYDSGNTFPFDVVQGGFIEQGCGAMLSPAKIDNSILWLGQDERGGRMAWRANGYTPVRISNHAVEWRWQQYATISDAVSYAWQYSGHSFWQIYFPTAGETWVYDCATGSWHERTSFISATNSFGPHLSQCHVFAWGMHLVGDWSSGNIYQVSPTAYTDNGQVIQRVRISPYIFREHQWMYHHELELDFEVGLGPQPPLTDGNGNPREPQAWLQWADDQAKEWSNGRFLDCGFAGDYLKRVHAHMLGKSRGRVYKVTCTDPVPWRLADAYLKATPNFVTQERLATQIGKMG